jgi:hypothetical protein
MRRNLSARQRLTLKMRELSVRSLLISHLAMLIVFCLFVLIGYSASLTVLHVFSGAELSDLHQRLKSDELFRDIEAASALSLSAVAAGWLAARTSNTRPLIHGAVSCGAFFLLFLYGTVHDLFNFPGIDLFRHRPLLRVSELALPLFGIIGASILLLRRRMPNREKISNESLRSIPGDLPSDDLFGDSGIAWRWLVRLIWSGSIATFEALEVLRYWSGKTYRPLFALFVAAICAFLIWLVASGFRDRRQRREARAERAASEQSPSPLHGAANGLVLALFGLTFYVGYVDHQHAPVPTFLWVVVALNIVALLLLRRALKWRYPYV